MSSCTKAVLYYTVLVLSALLMFVLINNLRVESKLLFVNSWELQTTKKIQIDKYWSSISIFSAALWHTLLLRSKKLVLVINALILKLSLAYYAMYVLKGRLFTHYNYHLYITIYLNIFYSCNYSKTILNHVACSVDHVFLDRARLKTWHLGP